METIEQFEERIYVNFIDGWVFVYPTTVGKGIAERWDFETTHRYLEILKNERLSEI